MVYSHFVFEHCFVSPAITIKDLHDYLNAGRVKTHKEIDRDAFECLKK